jgi:protein involved in polysaccharide export with SLBB domain
MEGRRSALVAVWLALLAGCAGSRTQLHHALRGDHFPAAHAHNLAEHYLVRCPDVLEIHVHDLRGCSGRYPVGPDGRIPLPPARSPRVAGQTAPQIARDLSGRLGVPLEQVHVAVAEHNSQQLYLVSEIDAQHQVLPYRGPETVLDVLQRVGLTREDDLGEIQVVRGHVADGKPPEVFHIDLQAIVLRHDLQTNIHLQPCDHIHLGQRQPSRLACCIPPWLRPLYARLWDVK